MIAAFFDVDGTLYTAHMWRGLMKYAAAHGRTGRVRLYYATLMPLYLLRKLGLITEEGFRKPWVPRLGWMLKGWSAAEGQAALEWVADAYIRPTAREDMLVCLREHVAAGHVVILVSAMLKPCLERVGKPLGVAGVVGTDVEVKDSYFTGRIIPPVCMGVEKDRLTRRFIQERGLDIDLSASYAYADSISDRELLDMVGHPVAVHPDARLRAHAVEKGWKILPQQGE